MNGRLMGLRIRGYMCVVLLLLVSAMANGQAVNAADMKPTPQQTEWQDLEFGVILHFGTNTFLDREWGDGTASPKVLNPTQFNPDQWMKAIKASGAKYVVMVAKHHDGLCLWPTAQTDYSIKQSPWKDGKGDMVREVAEAARANGLKFGVYLSPWDRHEPRYSDSAAYDKYYNAELEELASSYGELVEFWLDGAGSAGHVYDFPRIINTLRTYQPNTIVFADAGLFEYGDARWAGDESGRIEYQNWNVLDRHGYLRWRPVEVDTPLRKLHWFWHPNDEASLKSVDELMESYEGAVGHGGQWMLGVAPDSRGLLPDSDAARLRELGEAIRARYGYEHDLLKNHASVDANTEKALDGDTDTFWSAPEGSHEATLEVRTAKPITFDRALTMEWLVEGQQIQKYSIEAMIDGKWKPLVTSSAIGHKKIDKFPAVTTDRVRLHILTSAVTARIREFEVF
ncbi:MAG: alpha-L-fucosidase [Terracidiphilus sp.]|nr:alpha-L-fucosidase [Terracidiphilus sp.]